MEITDAGLYSGRYAYVNIFDLGGGSYQLQISDGGDFTGFSGTASFQFFKDFYMFGDKDYSKDGCNNNEIATNEHWDDQTIICNNVYVGDTWTSYFVGNKIGWQSYDNTFDGWTYNIKLDTYNFRNLFEQTHDIVFGKSCYYNVIRNSWNIRIERDGLYNTILSSNACRFGSTINYNELTNCAEIEFKNNCGYNKLINCTDCRFGNYAYNNELQNSEYLTMDDNCYYNYAFENSHIDAAYFGAHCHDNYIYNRIQDCTIGTGVRDCYFTRRLQEVSINDGTRELCVSAPLYNCTINTDGNDRLYINSSQSGVDWLNGIFGKSTRGLTAELDPDYNTDLLYATTNYQAQTTAPVLDSASILLPEGQALPNRISIIASDQGNSGTYNVSNWAHIPPSGFQLTLDGASLIGPDPNMTITCVAYDITSYVCTLYLRGDGGTYTIDNFQNFPDNRPVRVENPYLGSGFIFYLRGTSPINAEGQFDWVGTVTLREKDYIILEKVYDPVSGLNVIREIK
jgi:hypothetical protein